MANTTYGDISPRTAAFAEKKLLERAIPFLVLEKFGQSKPLPANNSKTIIFRRYSALQFTPTALVEGVTPGSLPLQKTDIPCVLTQYGSMVTITDVILDTHEDDVLGESIDLLGEQAAQMIETMRFGVLVAGTNFFYANKVGARNAVVATITLADQRRVTRALKAQNASQITKVVKSTPAWGTEAVAKAFIGLAHPDCEADLRNMVGADGKTVFTPVEKYGSMVPFENEIGKVEDVRYLTSTIFSSFKDAGGAKGVMTSTSGVSADVYPILYVGENAYAIVALRGAFALTPMVVNPKPSDSDPLAQRGRVAFKCMQGAVILNDQFLARLEIAVTA
jgi:N4-gp56 family major capsid protein